MSNLSKQSRGFVGALTMSSREIADLTNKRHDHIIRDIREIVEAVKDAPDLGDQLKQGLTEHKDARGYTSHFDLNRFAAELLVTGYDVARRARVVKRLLELEQKQMAPIANPAQLSRLQLIQLAMESEEERLALEAKVEEQAPKVEAHDRIADAAGSLSIRETATTLEYPERKLVQWFIQNEWAYRRNGNKNLLAYAASIKKGWLMHRVRVVPDHQTGDEKVAEQMRITPFGLTVLAKKLNLTPPYGGTPLTKPNAYLEARG